MRRSAWPFILVGLISIDACAGSYPRAMPLEIRQNADDGLTLKLAAAVQQAFVASGSFTAAANETPRLVVTIPGHVVWESVGVSVRVSYSVQFTDASNRELGTSHGSCWEDDLSVCARNVLTDGLRASREIR